MPGRGVVLNYGKSDLWGVGLAGHLMLSPMSPFTADDVRDYADADYQPVPECYGEGVRDLVKSMLRVNPGDRISTEDALVRAESMQAAAAAAAVVAAGAGHGAVAPVIAAVGGGGGGGEENLQARVAELEAAAAAEAAKVDLAHESRREAENRAVTAQRAAEARVAREVEAQLAQAQRATVAAERLAERQAAAAAASTTDAQRAARRAAAAAAEQVATAVAGMAKARRAADTAEGHAAAAVADAAQAREAVAAAEQQNRELRKQIEQIRGEGKEDLAVAAAAELREKIAMVGKPVRVQWGGGESYVGRITEFNKDDGKHMVIYTDGDVKWHDLDKMKWSEVSEAELKRE